MWEMGEIGVGDEEDTCLDEHGVMYDIVESLYCGHETVLTLYVNHAGIKILKNTQKE